MVRARINGLVVETKLNFYRRDRGHDSSELFGGNVRGRG